MSTSELTWELITKKRASSTQGIPPGKEHLARVTHTVTLIHGERDTVLVDAPVRSAVEGVGGLGGLQHFARLMGVPRPEGENHGRQRRYPSVPL
jgi:hypothetical protein